jgi:hypothetical protein
MRERENYEENPENLRKIKEEVQIINDTVQ